MDILKVLKVFNYILGTSVVAFSLYYYCTRNETVPLYIALSIIIAGPLEDYLKFYVHNSPSIQPENKKMYMEIIDNTTSLAFLILLLKATCSAVN